MTSSLQSIELRGRVVAVVVAGTHAVIAENLSPSERRTVTAMCLCAMEASDGQRPDPYAARDVLEHARLVKRRATASAPAHPARPRRATTRAPMRRSRRPR